MELPTLILVTRDTVLQQQILAHFKKTFHLIICSTLEDCLANCREQEIDSILVDLRFLISGGHQEDHLLEQIERHAPETELIMLTEEECPEILERRVACGTLKHIRGFASEAELLLDIDSLLNPEEKVLVSETMSMNAGGTPVASTGGSAGRGRSSGSRHNSQQEEIPLESDTSILHGITRRFETSSHEMKIMLKRTGNRRSARCHRTAHRGNRSRQNISLAADSRSLTPTG